MMVDDAVIGSRLQAARRALGLTQGDVGKQMGMATSTISAIESGKRSVSGPEIHAFARIYHRLVRPCRSGSGWPAVHSRQRQGRVLQAQLLSGPRIRTCPRSHGWSGRPGCTHRP